MLGNPDLHHADALVGRESSPEHKLFEDTCCGIMAWCQHWVRNMYLAWNIPSHHYILTMTEKTSYACQRQAVADDRARGQEVKGPNPEQKNHDDSR